MTDLQILLLLFAANGAPIILTRLLGGRFAAPVDGGLTLADGRALFGSSKTWRGLVSALLLTPLFAPVVGATAVEGMLVGGGAMLGDLLSSFAKRRIGVAPSGMALGLDQIPEALIPLLLLQNRWQLSGGDIVGLVVWFIGLELVLSRLLYWLHVRKQPY